MVAVLAPLPPALAATLANDCLSFDALWVPVHVPRVQDGTLRRLQQQKVELEEELWNLQRGATMVDKDVLAELVQRIDDVYHRQLQTDNQVCEGGTGSVGLARCVVIPRARDSRVSLSVCGRGRVRGRGRGRVRSADVVVLVVPLTAEAP